MNITQRWLSLLLASSALSASAKTILLNVRSGTADSVAATSADFAVADLNVAALAPVKVVADFAGLTTTVADEDGTNYTVSTTGGDVRGTYTAGTNSWNDLAPLSECYIFDRNTVTPNTITISGVEVFPAGDIITLTVYGVGDNFAQQSDFSATYAGATTAVQSTFYGDGPDQDQSVNSVPFVQFSFASDGTSTDLTINWTKFNNSQSNSNGNGAVFNGFSITTSSINLGDVTAATLTAPGQTTFIVGAPDVQLTATGDFTTAGAGVDVTALGSAGVITYESTNPSVASVSDKGLVTLMGPGTADITATVYGENSTEVTSTALPFVVEVPTSMTITPTGTSYLINYAHTLDLSVTATSASLSGIAVEGYTGLSYATDSPGNADVNTVTGVVTPYEAGSAIITAELLIPNQSAVTTTKTITVETILTMTISAPTSTVYVGGASTTATVQATTTNITTPVVLDGLANLEFYSYDTLVVDIEASTGVVTPGTTPNTTTIGAVFIFDSAETPFTLAEAPAKPTTMLHRYGFNNAAGAADAGTITDSVGGANGTVVGDSGLFTGSGLTLPGGAGNSTGAYVDLPDGIISPLGTAVTFEGWLTLDTLTSWVRMFDFGSGATSVVFAPRTSNNNLNGESQTRAGAGVVATTATYPSALVTAQRYHFVVTYDTEVGVRKIYRDGELVGSSPLPIGSSNLSAISDVNNWLGRSQAGGDQLLAGTYDEFRIYTGIMEPSEVSSNTIAGPDTIIVPESYATWATANAPGQDPDQDSDLDGTPNGVEYFMGETGSGFTSSSPSINDSEVLWTISAAFDGTYTIQTSPDLAIWTDVASTLGEGTVTYDMPTGTEPLFVRLKVIPTP